MTHLSAMTLDALRLGELPAPAAAEARAHLASCAACAERERALSAETASAAAGMDFAALAREATAAAGARGRVVWLRRAAAPVLALAAAVALVVLIPRERPDDAVRTKGGSPALELYVVRGEATEPLPQGAAVPGMRLRLHYDPAGRRWMRLLWSSRGQAPQPLAPAPDAPAIDTGGSAGWLPREIDVETDASSDVLYAVLCDTPVAHGEAVAELSGDTRADCIHLVAPLGRGKAP